MRRRGIVGSRLVMINLLLTMREMLFAVLSAVLSVFSSAITYCSCFCFGGCAGFDTNNCCCSGASEPKCLSSAVSSISFISLTRETTCSVEKPRISKDIAIGLSKGSLWTKVRVETQCDSWY